MFVFDLLCITLCPFYICNHLEEKAGCFAFIVLQMSWYSVRNKQLPTCPTQVKFAGGKLIDWDGCPLDKLKFQKIFFSCLL